MTNVEFNTFCRALPATTYVVQWGGSHVWKVGGKVFAIAGARDDKPSFFSFKVSDIAYEMLKDQPGLRPAPLPRIPRLEMDPTLGEVRPVRCRTAGLHPAIALHRAVGAASGDADAGDDCDQKIGDRVGVEASGDIAFTLRIADAADDNRAQACRQQRVDLSEVHGANAAIMRRRPPIARPSHRTCVVSQ
jgi:hypothetical protein